MGLSKYAGAFLLCAVSVVAQAKTEEERKRYHTKFEDMVYDVVVDRKPVTGFVTANGIHKFNVKPPSIERLQVRGQHVLHIEGQISHALRARSDDQYYYSVDVDLSGEVVRYQHGLHRGGFMATINKLTGYNTVSSAVGNFSLISNTPQAIANAMTQGVGDNIFGPWQEDAEWIALAIAKKAYENRAADRPTGRTHHDGRSSRSAQQITHDPTILGSGQNDYVAIFAGPFGEEMSFTLNGRLRLCAEGDNRCVWKSDDGSPSVEGCKKIKAKVGRRVLSYGFGEVRLHHAQLRRCND